MHRLVRPARTRTPQGIVPAGHVTLVVRFGACEFETDLEATRSKLAADLDKSLRNRRRSETWFREEHSGDARGAITEMALMGGGSKLCQPGNKQALLDYLDASPHGFLVMAAALAAVGNGVPVG